MKVILYARVSTRGQAEKGYSIRQQIEALQAHADKNGYDVLDTIPDEGCSGTTLDRPGLDRVRELVETVALTSCWRRIGTGSHGSPRFTTCWKPNSASMVPSWRL